MTPNSVCNQVTLATTTRASKFTHGMRPHRSNRIGRVGRADHLGLAISLVGAVPEKVRPAAVAPPLGGATVFESWELAAAYGLQASSLYGVPGAGSPPMRY